MVPCFSCYLSPSFGFSVLLSAASPSLYVNRCLRSGFPVPSKNQSSFILFLSLFFATIVIGITKLSFQIFFIQLNLGLAYLLSFKFPYFLLLRSQRYKLFCRSNYFTLASSASCFFFISSTILSCLFSFQILSFYSIQNALACCQRFQFWDLLFLELASTLAKDWFLFVMDRKLFPYFIFYVETYFLASRSSASIFLSLSISSSFLFVISLRRSAFFSSCSLKSGNQLSFFNDFRCVLFWLLVLVLKLTSGFPFGVTVLGSLLCYPSMLFPFSSFCLLTLTLILSPLS